MLDFCIGHLIPVAPDESRNENEERSKSPTVETIDDTLPTKTADETSEQTQQGQTSIGITFLFCYDYVYIHIHMSLWPLLLACNTFYINNCKLHTNTGIILKL